MGRASRSFREAHELGAALRRFSRALVRRAEAGDTEALEALVTARDAAGDAVGDAVRGLHAYGYTVAEIATVLGTSPQNVHKRWLKEDK